ncbi:UDP-glycosyltransferase 85A8-like [Olea europaea var. sylvestris]|uniref:UDP-glycosyltransferase 85A8-like n=1 Tax=Olea europaea var. sylvestris TaxID=158386 RepID=UPI000C1D1A3E|nr:UDP-glycosyltransferase 85A8-like [Olea europaea var. sylvestris]
MGMKYGVYMANFSRTQQGMETIGLPPSPLLQRIAWLLVWGRRDQIIEILFSSPRYYDGLRQWAMISGSRRRRRRSGLSGKIVSTGNLWKEETGCLEWLNPKKRNSVVYVNFGSITVLTPQQLVEFAWGLANSKKNFVWIIRSDTVVGDSANLPSEFVEETKERGLIASWCPQEQVLNHPSIGVFLTHCGWNSTIESMSCGVPMICWPFFADQFINCRFSCTEWGVGLEIDNNVDRVEVEKIVRELIDGKKGKKMKNKAVEWMKKAKGATEINGSSHLNFDKFVEVLLSKKNNNMMA